jgi:uncharacterized membrane protein
MTPHWEKLPGALEREAQGPVFMDAHLTPNRALSVRAFTLLILVFCGINTGLAVLFWMQGAWPVVGFLALDVALLYVAFRINYRDGRISERVHVSAARVQLTRTDQQGRSLHWQVHPAWARVEPNSEAVLVSAGASCLRLASFLSPPERADFAAALNAAIIRARAYRPNTSEIE